MILFLFLLLFISSSFPLSLTLLVLFILLIFSFIVFYFFPHSPVIPFPILSSYSLLSSPICLLSTFLFVASLFYSTFSPFDSLFSSLFSSFFLYSSPSVFFIFHFILSPFLDFLSLFSS